MKFRVLVQKHQLKGKAIAKFHDVVDESQLNGNASELVKAGFVEAVDSEEDSFDLGKLTLAELKDFAKANDLVVTATSKAKMLDEIEEQLDKLVVVDSEEVKED